MKLEVLGECSSPSCLSYLDNGVVFVGSTFGDPQLIKLTEEECEGGGGGFVQVLESYTSLAPILDFSVVDLERQGHELVVSCCGYGKDGSLKVVRSGVGINEAASIDLSGIKGVWSLHTGPSPDPLDNMLVVSFVGQTMVLSLNGEEVEETEAQGLSCDQQTFYCGNVVGKKIVQITSQSVRLINQETMELVCEWRPPSGRNISTVGCNRSQAVVAVGRELHYLELKSGSVEEVSHVSMEYEVSCVDLTPLGAEVGVAGGGALERADICAVGLWTEVSVRMLLLPSLETINTQLLGGDIIPRSVLLVSFGAVHYLLIALGDGTLMYSTVDPDIGNLTQMKKVILGTKAIVLKMFRSGNTVNVFACSNHPTIIHYSNQKLLFSNVNHKEVNYLCTLNSEAFKESLALVDSSTMTIGSLDEIQKLHIHSYPFGETVRRITYQESSHTFAVISMVTERLESDSMQAVRESASTICANVSTSSLPEDETEGGGVPTLPSDLPPGVTTESFSVLLVDETTFEVLHVYKLCPREHGVSITSCQLGVDPCSNYYVIGTAFIDPQEREPSKGRILVFSVKGGRLSLVASVMEDGSVYQVTQLCENKLLVSVNSSVCVYNLTEENQLVKECSYGNTILSLFLKTKGDFILVGDLLRSFKLLLYKEGKGLSEISAEVRLNPVFLTAMEMIDDETFIGADGRHVFVCQKNNEAVLESDLAYMLQPSRIYLGDNINVFGRGSLVMEHPGSSSSPFQCKPILYGTVHGAIGLVGQLQTDTFSLLSKVEENMIQAIKSVGCVDHEAFRAFSSEHKSKMSEGFVDGDVVEKFIDLTQTQMENVCKGIKVPDGQGGEVDVCVDDVVKLIEDLTRMH